MKTTIFVQARLNSTRFPEKIRAPIWGQPLLHHTLTRLKTLNYPVVLAVPKSDRQEFYQELKKRYNIPLFLGEEESVLNRFYHAACAHPTDLIVRVTGDCPLVQPTLLHQMITFFQKHYDRYDYVSNVIDRSYPKGMDLEIFKFEGLKKIYQESECAYTKEHVTPPFYQDKIKWRVYNFKHTQDLSHINVSIDTEDDLKRVQKFFEKYAPINPLFELADMQESLLCT